MRFSISYMTKPIVAAALMILVEECKLWLDEPVDRLLPELVDRKALYPLRGTPSGRGMRPPFLSASLVVQK